MQSFSKHLNSLIFWLMFTIAAAWVADRAEAQAVKRALKQVAEQLSKSSDESARMIGESASHLARSGDDVLERLGRDLGSAGSTLSIPRTVDELRRLGVLNATADFSRLLDDLPPASRRGLIEVLEQSKRAFDVGIRNGIDTSRVLGSLKKGGPDAILSLHSMKSDEGIVGCLRGFDEFGEAFNQFVRKGDEAAVHALNEHWDNVRRLPRSAQDNLLSNPAKYVDANGRLTRGGDELFRKGRGAKAEGGGWTRKGLIAGVVSAVAFALSPDSILDILDPVLPPAVASLLRSIKWFLWWGLVLAVLWYLSPILLPLSRWALIGLFRLLSRLPGRLGTLLQSRLERLTATANRGMFKPSGRQKRTLRIGLLGVQRVGKSTFIVMLQKHLSRLVPGASLEAVGENDAESLRVIEDQVSRCQPTREDQIVRLNLTWPFDRDGNPRDTSDGNSEGTVGVLKERLDLTDFPGEWAARDASKDDHKKLINHLKNVDGLIVVIDPTELENPDGRERACAQIEAIRAMFREEDGLGLGQRFHRAIAVLFTKRDALTPELLNRLADRVAARSGEGERPDVGRIIELAGANALSPDQSQELGKALFDLLFPSERQALRMHLEPIVPNRTSSSFWGRLRRWFRRSNRPQFAIFAISQLGKELGRQVVEHRQRVVEHRQRMDAWERLGRPKGEEPLICLNLENADAAQLEIHHPFQWMFDKIPEGCLYQADQLGGATALHYRRSVHNRFRGAAVVRRDWRVSLAQRICALACLVIAGSITQPLADWKQRRDERQQVVQLFEDAAGKDLANDELELRFRDARTLRTNPLPEELKLFELLLSAKKRLDALRESSRTPNRPLNDRIGDLRDWLRTVADLPPVISPPFKSLQVFRERIASPTAEVASNALGLTEQRTNELVKEASFDDAHNVAEKLCLALDLTPGEVGSRAESHRLAESLIRRHFQHDLAHLQERISLLLACTPPDFVTAVEAVDGFWAAKQKTTDMDENLKALRSEQVGRFRDYIDGRLDDLIRERKVDDIYRLFEQLERSSKPNDPAKNWVSEQRSDLPDRRVRSAANSARGDLQQGDPKAGWDKLNAVRTLLTDAKSGSRQEWCEVSARIRLQQQEWEHAVSLFCEKEIRELPWAREGRSKAWHDWTEALEKSVQLALAQGKTGDALKSIARHQNCQFAETCPQDDRVLVGKLAAAVPQRELGLMLEEAAKRVDAGHRDAKELEKALQLLTEARSSASRVRNEDSELLLRWRKDLIDVLEKLGRHSDAVSFHRTLSTDPAFSMRIPTSTKPTESDVWDHYLLYLQDKYQSLQKVGKEREAFSLLARARADVLVTEKFSKDIEEFASTRINSRLAELNRVVELKLAKADFTGAIMAVEAAQEELGDWKRKGLPAFDRLAKFKPHIRKQQLDHLLDGVNADLKEKNRRGEELHKKIDAMSKEPDLSDDQRNRLIRLRDGNLTSWERDQYGKIKTAYDDRRFSDLEDAVKKYTGDEPYRDKRPPTRLNSAKDIRNWLERLETEQNYSLSAIRIERMPTSLISNYDPAAKISVRSSTLFVITAQEDNKAGAFELRAFKTASTFRWKKGAAIEFGLWDDEVEKKGNCMGKDTLNDPYSLLDIGLPGAWRPVPHGKYDYAKDSGFGNLKIGLTIDGLKLPTLAP